MRLAGHKTRGAVADAALSDAQVLGLGVVSLPSRAPGGAPSSQPAALSANATEPGCVVVRV